MSKARPKRLQPSQQALACLSRDNAAGLACRTAAAGRGLPRNAATLWHMAVLPLGSTRHVNMSNLAFFGLWSQNDQLATSGDTLKTYKTCSG